MSPAGFEGLRGGAATERRRARARTRASLGMPWVLALVQALAVIIAGIVGLAIALFP